MSYRWATSDDKYWYAELLWALAVSSKHKDRLRQQWMAAAEAFDVAAEEHASKTVRRASAHAAALAWKHTLAGAKLNEPTRTPKRCTTPKPLSRHVGRFIAAIRRYGTYLRRDDDRLLLMRFWEANLRARSCDHARALPLLTTIIKTLPDSELGVRAAELGITSLRQLGRRAEAARWSKALERLKKTRAKRPTVPPENPQ